MGKNYFNENCLSQKDESGISIREWYKADKGVYSTYYYLWCKTFQISNSGFKQVVAHSSGKKHQDLGKGLFGSGQRHFSVKTPIIQDTEKPSRSQQERKSEIVVDKSAKEAATQAELLILFM